MMKKEINELRERRKSCMNTNIYIYIVLIIDNRMKNGIK